MVPQANRRTVRLPVLAQNGSFALLDGRPLPKLREGAIGDLVIDADDLVNAQDRVEWTTEKAVQFLPRDTLLWARVKREDVPRELQTSVADKREWPNVQIHAVGFKLIADLELLLRAGKKAALNPCPCHIPALNLDVKSVNEAYTKISVAYEPGRRSHAGNVFLCVFYERDGFLRPLEDRRGSVELAVDSTPPGQGNQQQREMNLSPPPP